MTKKRMTKQRKHLSTQFMQLMHLYGHLYRHQMQETYKNKDFHPHKGQGRVLAILKMQPEIMQKELGYLLDISTQALAELINKLEKKGYLTREQSKKDRRSFVIQLTDSGREATPDENEDVEYNYIEDIFDCLDDEEQAHLIDYIERITKNIEKELGEDDYITFFRKRFFEKHENKHNLSQELWNMHNHDFNHSRHSQFRNFGDDEYGR